jgi:hypothetical protein
MNGGTTRGQAHGIRLSSLVRKDTPTQSPTSLFLPHPPPLSFPQLKLVECRKNGSKSENLLHHVLRLYRQKHPPPSPAPGDVSAAPGDLFYSKWENIWLAKAVRLIILLLCLSLFSSRPPCLSVSEAFIKTTGG